MWKGPYCLDIIEYSDPADDSLWFVLMALYERETEVYHQKDWRYRAAFRSRDTARGYARDEYPWLPIVGETVVLA